MRDHRQVVIVGGYFARCPLGGYAWQVLHYILGLRTLGYHPVFYESTEFVSDCFDPRRREFIDSCANSIDTVAAFFSRHGLDQNWAVFDARSGQWFGLPRTAFREACMQATIAISLAAVQPLPETPRAVRVFIDLDPGYTQIRLAQGDTALREFVAAYHRHFTIGERIGHPDCPVPSAGFSWLPTRQPVVLDLWRLPPPQRGTPFTTIGRWHEHRRVVEFDGKRFGWSKRDEWSQFIDLPRQTGAQFVLAMDVDKYPEDLAWLRNHRWEVVDPLEVSADPFRYQGFIAHSIGEFSSAKDLNIRLRTGWFSDRSASYLAAGRCVVTQSTGFEEFLPTQAGLFAVQDIEEAREAVLSIVRDPVRHSQAAREIAENYFEAKKVLQELLQRL